MCRVHRQFFTKSFLGDDAADLARSSGEEPASPRHRAGVGRWRGGRRDDSRRHVLDVDAPGRARRHVRRRRTSRRAAPRRVAAAERVGRRGRRRRRRLPPVVDGGPDAAQGGRLGRRRARPGGDGPLRHARAARQGVRRRHQRLAEARRGRRARRAGLRAPPAGQGAGGLRRERPPRARRAPRDEGRREVLRKGRVRPRRGRVALPRPRGRAAARVPPLDAARGRGVVHDGAAPLGRRRRAAAARLAAAPLAAPRPGARAHVHVRRRHGARRRDGLPRVPAPRDRLRVRGRRAGPAAGAGAGGGAVGVPRRHSRQDALDPAGQGPPRALERVRRRRRRRGRRRRAAVFACVEIKPSRRRRVDGVGRPKFDFHTGPCSGRRACPGSGRPCCGRAWRSARSSCASGRTRWCGCWLLPSTRRVSRGASRIRLHHNLHAIDATPAHGSISTQVRAVTHGRRELPLSRAAGHEPAARARARLPSKTKRRKLARG